MSERAVGGRPISGNDRPSRSFKAGRVCRERGCETVLSIYNNGSFCSQHATVTIDLMDLLAAAKPWTFWLAPLLVLVTVLALLAVMIGYVVKVVAARYPRG